jgi:hypothetical protein
MSMAYQEALRHSAKQEIEIRTEDTQKSQAQADEKQEPKRHMQRIIMSPRYTQRISKTLRFVQGLKRSWKHVDTEEDLGLIQMANKILRYCTVHAVAKLSLPKNLRYSTCRAEYKQLSKMSAQAKHMNKIYKQRLCEIHFQAEVKQESKIHANAK